jgi:hypothetical protein
MGLGQLLDDYGRAFHAAKVTDGNRGTKQRADAARVALVDAFRAAERDALDMAARIADSFAVKEHDDGAIIARSIRDAMDGKREEPKNGSPPLHRHQV